jgi:hypothetical protein
MNIPISEYLNIQISFAVCFLKKGKCGRRKREKILRGEIILDFGQR